MSSKQCFGNFDLIKRIELDSTDVVISKWQSRCTGLSVVHLDYEAPLVNGYFVVATEIFDDSGCPHTLEHLVFMGSERYPYKGILDQFANRGFSNGTNAWTANDHTAYTISTVGEQGFLQLLPIYMDHILYPLMNTSGYVTEVHHIDGKGQDSGVVYSEMQGRENTSSDLMALRSQRLMNLPGSAYRSETGGLMHALRVLTLEQIKRYHTAYYVPHNISLVISGKFSNGPLSLLEILQQQVEPILISRGGNKGPRPPGWKRPFIETESATRRPIQEITRSVVEFPEKDESMGNLLINVLGPPPTAFLERKALDILGTYLTSSPVAPLNKEFVEIESPLCSYIYFGENTKASFIDLPIYVGSVPTEHLNDFDRKLHASLKRISTEGIDMKRMEMIINRDERQFRSTLESAKGETFSGSIIVDFLYCAQDGSQLGDAVDDVNQYTELRTWTNEKWTSLLQKYYIEPPFLVVIGKPSAELVAKLELEEKDRISKQVAILGPEGLKKAEAQLEASKAENDSPIPKKLLTSFPVPPLQGISWIPVESVQEPGIGRSRKSILNDDKMRTDLESHVSTDGSPLPFFVQYDHVQSDFVTITAMLSVNKLPTRLRPYISVYLSAFFSLPLVRGSGEKLTHEEVVNKLDDETVSYAIGLGISGYFSEMISVAIKVETRLYETAIIWLRDLIYGSEFNKERLQVVVAKIQQYLPELKRDGSTVLSSTWDDLIYSEESTARASGSIFLQADFIPKLGKQLRDAPDEVIVDFKDIRRCLTEPSGMRFSVAGNILGLQKPRSLWGEHFSELKECDLAAVPFSSEVLSDIGKHPVQRALITALPTIESTFVVHTTKTIQGFLHPEYPVIRVALEVLNATESYLWRYIRGSGLAYGASIYIDLEAGLLSFSLYRSTNSIAAYREAAKVLQGVSDGSIPLESTTLDAAKSSIVYGVASNFATAGLAALASFSNQALKDVPKTHQIDLLNKYQAVTEGEVLEALRKHFLPLFDPSSSVAVVVASPSKAEKIKEDLKLIGFDVEERSVTLDASGIVKEKVT